jgi:3-phosphoshikimate 1-carboxyvinyltransferase
VSRVSVEPAAQALGGTLRVPGDKSIAHRALLFAALARGSSRIMGLPAGADVTSTREAVVRLGAVVRAAGTDAEVEGAGLALGGGRDLTIDCGNSGTTMRLVAGLVAARPGATTLTGDASLSRRPMERVARPLRAMGATIDTTDGHAPLTVRGTTLRPIDWTPEVASAQVKSAILLAGLRTAGTTTVGDAARTRDHSERLLGHLGARVERRGDRVAVTGGHPLRAAAIPVPGDPSSAAFWLVAGSIVPGSRLVLSDVCVNETRTGLVAILRRMGADIELRNRREQAGEPWADVVVRAAPLRGTVVEAAEVPATIDELPVLAVAAACATGETVVWGAGELRAKESDRLAALGRLQPLGVDVTVHRDGFTVRGRPDRPLDGGVARADGDHRVAMSLAIAGLVSRDGVTIEDADAVAVSYPGFFDDLATLRRGAA